MASYIAIIHKDGDSDFGVSFPDFPGCITAGETLDEARELAAEALALHVAGMVEDGEAIPAPSSLEEVMKDAVARSGVATLVDLPRADVRAVRLNITLPSDVLEAIDAHVETNGMTRSGYLAQIARKHLRRSAA
jgi:predicted RNase H-like HicB family nuclease